MKFIIFVLLNLSSIICLSQNQIFIGDKLYASTSKLTINTNCQNQSFEDKKPSISFYLVKDVTNNMIIFENEWLVCGTILIYLDDNTIIKCFYKNRFDYVNGLYSSIYYLSFAEINSLKNSNISAIRFNITPSPEILQYGTPESYIVNNVSFTCSEIKWGGGYNNLGSHHENVIYPRIDFTAIFNEFFK